MRLYIRLLIDYIFFKYDISNLGVHNCGPCSRELRRLGNTFMFLNVVSRSIQANGVVRSDLRVRISLLRDIVMSVSWHRNQHLQVQLYLSGNCNSFSPFCLTSDLRLFKILISALK